MVLTIRKMELEELSKISPLVGDYRALSFPKYFEIGVADICNAKCIDCIVWNSSGGLMSDELFNKIAGEISHYSNLVERVCLSRDGEPLMDKKINKKIVLLKKYGIKEVSISTNASLLTERKSISLIESGLDDIRFSIDGATKETFEYIRKGLSFEKVRENCLRFIKLRNERGNKPRIHVRMVLQNANRHEENDFNNFWTNWVSENDVVSSKPMHSWGGQLRAYSNLDSRSEDYTNEPCTFLLRTLIVHYNGLVPLCVCDYQNKYNMGDLNSSTMMEIWNSGKFQKIREMHLNRKRNDIPFCQVCHIWDKGVKKIYSKKK